MPGSQRGLPGVFDRECTGRSTSPPLLITCSCSEETLDLDALTLYLFIPWYLLAATMPSPVLMFESRSRFQEVLKAMRSTFEVKGSVDIDRWSNQSRKAKKVLTSMH